MKFTHEKCLKLYRSAFSSMEAETNAEKLSDALDEVKAIIMRGDPDPDYQEALRLRPIIRTWIADLDATALIFRTLFIDMSKITEGSSAQIALARKQIGAGQIAKWREVVGQISELPPAKIDAIREGLRAHARQAEFWLDAIGGGLYRGKTLQDMMSDISKAA